MSDKLKKMPECPAHLKSEARSFWERVGPLLIAAGAMTESDLGAFEITAATFALWRQADAEIAKNGLTHISPNGHSQVSPMVSIAARARCDYLKFARKFGLDPRDRESLKPKESEDESLPAFGDF